MSSNFYTALYKTRILLKLEGSHKRFIRTIIWNGCLKVKVLVWVVDWVVSGSGLVPDCCEYGSKCLASRNVCMLLVQLSGFQETPSADKSSVIIYVFYCTSQVYLYRPRILRLYFFLSSFRSVSLNLYLYFCNFKCIIIITIIIITPISV